MRASLEIAKGGLSQKFMTRNTLVPGESIVMDWSKGRSNSFTVYGRSSRWARKPARSVWICPSIMPAPSFVPRWGRCSIRQPTRWWMHSASERKSCMADASIQIEVVYASVQRQVLKTVDVPVGSSVRQALALSGMDKEFPELDLSQCAVGIFGKVVADPAARVLETGSG